ncbi:MAG: PIN domain nuclease [Deltaproteobacteria bacterium]|nr:PIN domain nuclease [Deltaproteobacteria bacterium]MCL5276849.1 PIN domain nuclease [Deltaproteobacteria bacterium]
MILVDSSVWIYYYRPGGADRIKDLIIDAITGDEIAVNGIIKVEILNGITEEKDFEKVKSDFDAFVTIALDDPVFMTAGELGSSLRKKGFSIPATDLIIAASALKSGCSLFHIDSHFDTIARYAPLNARNLKHLM